MTAEQAAHRIELDEMIDGDDHAYKAFCDCGWSADHWSHSDSMPAYDRRDPLSIDPARDEAFDDAESEGQQHVTDEQSTAADQDDDVCIPPVSR